MKQHFATCMTIALVFLPYLIWADSGNWQPGYVLKTSETDTLRGELSYSGWADNPNEVIFRVNASSEEQHFNTTNCKGFGVFIDKKNWDNYRLFAIDLEVSEYNLNKVDGEKNPIYAKKSLFLRTICTGTKASLWVYNHDNRMHLFLQKGTDLPAELVKKQFYTDVDKTMLSTNSMYKQQLSVAFSDCKKEVDWLSIPYEIANIEKKVKEYNTCMSGTVLYEAITEKTVVKIGLVAGIGTAALEFSTSSNASNPNNKSGIGIVSGISLNIILPRTQQHWSIFNELTYSTYTATTNKTVFTQYGSTSYNTGTSDWKMAYLNLNIMGRYTFSQGIIAPYIGVGIRNGLAITAENSYMNSIYANGANAVPVTDNTMSTIRPLEQALVIDGGILALKHINVNARAEFSNGFSNFIALNSKLTILYLMLGYTF